MNLIRPGLLLILLALAPGAGAQSPPPTIAVSGTGESVVTPDVAIVTLGVSAQGKTAAEALERNSAAMASVFDLLEADGLAKADIRTSQFSLSPLWQNDSSGNAPAQIGGYQVYNLVTVRLREVDRLGALLDRLTRGGVNQIDGIAFETADMRKAVEAARRAAVLDARARAELYASAAGVTLGPLLSLSESGSNIVQPGMMLRAEAAAPDRPVPVSVGEGTVRADVSLVFAIRP